MSHAGGHLREARLARGISPQALAYLIGYKNLDKGARRITTFETTGDADAQLVSAMVAGLGLDLDEVDHLAALDRRDATAAFEAWLAEPVEPKLFLLPLLAIRVRVLLPDDIKRDRDKAAGYTLGQARERGCRACLVWDRRWSFWVWYRRRSAHVQADELVGGWIETAPAGPNEPHARVRRRGVTLTLE